MNYNQNDLTVLRSVVGRTFPTHPYFSRQMGNGQLALFNLLKAYSLVDEGVGYCQGLSFVAGVLVMNVSRKLDRNLNSFKKYIRTRNKLVDW